MQGSFWKTVALVAVIGVGSLAILEVQNRLKNSPSALDVSDGSEQTDLAAELRAATENQVNAQLSESEFDKMAKAGFPPSSEQTAAVGASSFGAGFDLSEPSGELGGGDLADSKLADSKLADSAGLTFDAVADAEAAKFSLAAIDQNSANLQQTDAVAGDWESAVPFGNTEVQLASSTAVDTSVDPDQLSQTPNPFAMADAAGNADASSNQVQPTSFVEEGQLGSASDAPSPFAAFDPAKADSDSSFPVPTNESGAASASTTAASRVANNQGATSPQVGQLQFYNGVDREESASSEPKTVSATPIAFDQEFPENTFDTSNDLGGGFQEFPTGDGAASDPASTFQDFNFGPEPSVNPRQPERIPTPDLSGNSGGSPFFEELPASEFSGDDDLVPMPRDRPDGSIASDGNESSRGSFDDSMSGADSLPFVEDGGSTVPVLNAVPVPGRGGGRDGGGRDDGLSIPMNGQDREPTSPAGRPSFEGGSFDGGGFEGGGFEGGRFPGGGLDTEPSNPRLDLNSGNDRDRQMNWEPEFDEAPVANPRRTEPMAPRTPERRIPERDQMQSDPFGRSNLIPEGRDSSMDRPERTFGNDGMNRPEVREINPGFDSEPRRIPSVEDRRNELRLPMGNGVRNEPPARINPGFDSDFSNSERMDRDRTEQDFDIDGRSRPVREFGGSSRSEDDSDQPSYRDSAFGENSGGGSGPVRNEREFGGSSSNGRQENLRNVDERMGGNVRQIASVMRPKLVLQKDAPENATVGTPLQYSITVRNDGDAHAYDVVVEDELTASSRIDAAKPQASRSNDGERLVWEFDSIAPGEEEEIQVQVTPTGEGVLDGIATVKFKSRVKATTMITAPRLELKMEGPDEVRLGDKVQYRYVITNEGSGEARSVFVRTVLPQNGGLRHPQGQDLEYEIPLMEPGEQREILLSVVAGEPGSQQAQAFVTSRNGSKDQAAWSTDVVGAQLQMLRRGPKRRFVSKTARYENIVTNETSFDAKDARVVERIPPGMEFKAAGQGGRFDPRERTVTWEIRRLAAKATTTLQLELEPRVAGQQDSRVTIFENIGAQSDDYVSTTVVEDLHNVSATISQLDGPVALGEVFGFTIAVDNRGTADATDIQLSVEVPPEIEVFGAGTKEFPAGLKRGTNTVVYQMVVRIKPNQQQDFELKLRGIRPGRNKIVKASVKYTQMSEPLEISESVTIYDDRN